MHLRFFLFFHKSARLDCAHCTWSNKNARLGFTYPDDVQFVYKFWIFHYCEPVLFLHFKLLSIQITLFKRKWNEIIWNNSTHRSLWYHSKKNSRKRKLFTAILKECFVYVIVFNEISLVKTSNFLSMDCFQMQIVIIFVLLNKILITIEFKRATYLQMKK